eukprot:TRINITY_DN2173_c0_g1::TRINITY_DN2173_c0_g1_i1::g.12911::m.12911 TRINITY_DN2173_c0_g1::TRINITY_DN2173_c0_g1_i1::g.12911  ORF type:complete len:850 (+),score=213.12,sp/C1CXK0/RS18_DEIDV/44.07/2e-09,Ribosomal_S18/PF01084.15/1.9e-12 TRINITY_DN2173_c0_g1_i1:37-2586(+)
MASAVKILRNAGSLPAFRRKIHHSVALQTKKDDDLLNDILGQKPSNAANTNPTQPKNPTTSDFAKLLEKARVVKTTNSPRRISPRPIAAGLRAEPLKETLSLKDSQDQQPADQTQPLPQTPVPKDWTTNVTSSSTEKGPNFRIFSTLDKLRVGQIGREYRYNQLFSLLIPDWMEEFAGAELSQSEVNRIARIVGQEHFWWDAEGNVIRPKGMPLDDATLAEVSKKYSENDVRFEQEVAKVIEENYKDQESNLTADQRRTLDDMKTLFSKPLESHRTLEDAFKKLGESPEGIHVAEGDEAGEKLNAQLSEWKKRKYAMLFKVLQQRYPHLDLNTFDREDFELLFAEEESESHTLGLSWPPLSGKLPPAKPKDGEDALESDPAKKFTHHLLPHHAQMANRTHFISEDKHARTSGNYGLDPDILEMTRIARLYDALTLLREEALDAGAPLRRLTFPMAQTDSQDTHEQEYVKKALDIQARFNLNNDFLHTVEDAMFLKRHDPDMYALFRKMVRRDDFTMHPQFRPRLQRHEAELRAMKHAGVDPRSAEYALSTERLGLVADVERAAYIQACRHYVSLLDTVSQGDAQLMHDTKTSTTGLDHIALAAKTNETRTRTQQRVNKLKAVLESMSKPLRIVLREDGMSGNETAAPADRMLNRLQAMHDTQDTMNQAQSMQGQDMSQEDATHSWSFMARPPTQQRPFVEPDEFSGVPTEMDSMSPRARRVAMQEALRKKLKAKGCEICLLYSDDKMGTKKIVDFKDIALITRYMSDTGMFLKRSHTGLCKVHQMRVIRSIKTARQIAMIPLFSKPRQYLSPQNRPMSNAELRQIIETFNLSAYDAKLASDSAPAPATK